MIVLVIPPAIACVWIAVFGGTALWIVRAETTPIRKSELLRIQKEIKKQSEIQRQKNK